MAECGLQRLQIDSSVKFNPVLAVTVVAHVDDLAITSSMINAEAVMAQIQSKLKIKKADRLKATSDKHELLGRPIRRTVRAAIRLRQTTRSCSVCLESSTCSSAKQQTRQPQ